MRTFKKSIISTLSAATIMSFIALPASAVSMPPSLEKDLVHICEAIKSNDRSDLRKNLRSNNLSYQKVSKDLVCNGMSAADFARQNNADETATLLSRYSRNDGKFVAKASF